MDGFESVWQTRPQSRFARSLNNLFNVFSAEVDACRCFMNSSAAPELVFEQHGDVRSILQAEQHAHLLNEAAPT